MREMCVRAWVRVYVYEYMIHVYYGRGNILIGTNTQLRAQIHNCAGTAGIDSALEAMKVSDFLSHTGVQVSGEEEGGREGARERENERKKARNTHARARAHTHTHRNSSTCTHTIFRALLVYWCRYPSVDLHTSDADSFT